MSAIWTTPKTWQVDELLTATDMNTHLRDNLDYLKLLADLLTGEGYARLEEQQPDGVNGGTFTSGAWRTRQLNTVAVDKGGFVTLNNAAITLPAGTYYGRAMAMGYRVNRHRLRLFNTDDGTTLALGAVAVADSGTVDGGYAALSTVFTLSASKTLELQHRCVTTQATNGFGRASGWGDVEIYASLELWRLKP